MVLSALPVGSFQGKGSIYLTGAAQTFSEHKLKSHCVEEMERQKITQIIFIRILIQKKYRKPVKMSIGQQSILKQIKEKDIYRNRSIINIKTAHLEKNETMNPTKTFKPHMERRYNWTF